MRKDLFDDNLGAPLGAAGERAFFDSFEADDAVFGGVNREVAADVGARTSNFGVACLADENFALADFLAAVALDAQSSAIWLAASPNRTASFNV